MKLEVGKFVRTKDGTIGKIIAIDLAKPRQEKYPNHPSKRWWRDKILISCYKGWITTQNIIKASYNIIDILEVGDVIKLFMGYNIDEENTNIFELIAINYDNNEIGVFNSDFQIEFFPIENLRGILTHEQMEQMAYKVGD